MSVTKLTRKYISEHASIKDCLRQGLINYSALSRQICDDSNIKRFDAVLIACRRYFERLKDQPTHEKKIMRLIKKAKIRMRNKIIVAITEKPRDYERLYALQKTIKKERGDFHLIEGDEALVLITNSDYLADVKECFKGRIKKISEDLVQISMAFDEAIEATPGVVSYVYGLLADNGINILEEMSCWTDLLLVISESDAEKAIRVLTH